MATLDPRDRVDLFSKGRIVVVVVAVVVGHMGARTGSSRYSYGIDFFSLCARVRGSIGPTRPRIRARIFIRGSGWHNSGLIKHG